MPTIAIDFDGTIASNAFPDIKNAIPNHPVIEWMKRRQSKGDKFILWTCRENYGGKNFPDAEYRNDACRFCTMNKLFFDNVNSNIGEYGFEQENYGRKIMADFYLDDKSLPFNSTGKLSWLWWKIYLKLVDRLLDSK